MPHLAHNYERHIGHAVGSGQCVALLRECAGLPPTAQWRRGALVRGSSPDHGTCIATFTPAGRYANATSGASHAAILIAEQSDGLHVCDQWLGQKCHTRVIWFRDGRGKAANDGDRFYIIELADDGAG